MCISTRTALVFLALLAACTETPVPSVASNARSAPPPGAAPALAGTPAATASSSAPSGDAGTAPSALRAAAPLPPGPIDKLRETALHSSRALETVRSLVDSAGARLAGSPGDRAAVAWGLRTLAAYGFSHVRAEKVTVPHWERGIETGALVSPYRHRLVLAALGGSVATPKNGIEAEVIEAPSLDALDKLDPASVKGKIVFFSTKMERTKDGSGYGRAVPVRGAAAVRAAKLGAVAAVIRSIGTSKSRTPHTGAMSYDKDVPKIPVAALSIPDAEMLARILAEGKPVRLAMTLTPRTLPDTESANVIGEVPGREAPDEIVLLGAHLDSWDLGHGAIDDGAGCAIVIEAGRLIAALPQKPRRTIRVVLFANEENGLRGARTYAKEHEAEIAKHVVAMEADFGAGRVYSVRVLGGAQSLPLLQTIAKPLLPLGVEIASDPGRGGADLSPLRALGVPVIDLQQDGSLYFDVHHSANDTLDQITKEDLEQVAAAFTVMAYAAADMKEDFGRIPEESRARKR